ncbi:threonine synthase [Albibacterium sp.]|uniref:threonine synthase n=1 Tax=Albibacterium sp. TaxID=2952885 RepID=UPI002B61E3AE|nr:threonine synthase [Albibacterium sp.]HUH19575.1 threonine synthase [Albibacterium sp.]
MRFYSTNSKQSFVPFREAVFSSLPKDKGLYMPESIPTLDVEFIKNIDQYSFSEIAFKVAENIIGDDIPAADLKRIIEETVNFDAPLIALKDGSYILELFQGPSLAFKDFGARFMSRVMAYFSEKSKQTLDVLVATSGDTGGAVALGFTGVPNTRVTILFPKGKVSAIQELQLCTNDSNIHALEIDGTFDDCQALVKKAFNDDDLNEKLNLTSANSINISRLIPQTFYYFYAYSQLVKKGIKEVVFSVPSGNFGNLTAGLFAAKMGLPVKHFIAATNANDVVPRFLSGQAYETRAAIATLSNAMDVGNPSNWDRIMDLFDQDTDKIKKQLTADTYSDKQTTAAIEEVYYKNQYIVCPHTAIAWLAGQAYRTKNQGDYALVALSTAHPCKFPDVFPKGIGENIKVPESVNELRKGEQKKQLLGTSFSEFKTYLLNYPA